MKPGEVLDQCQKFGMIKLGSRAELIVPVEDDLQIDVQLGQWVNAGRHVLARYTGAARTNPAPLLTTHIAFP
jgi:phosphatidylserine decarboxylase